MWESTKLIILNKSISTSFPGGSYKNYLRLLVPKGTILDKVTVGGKPLDLLLVKYEPIAGKISYGFLVEVPVKEGLLVDISYHLGQKLNLSQGSEYFLYLQKQSGAVTNNFSFSFQSPQKSLLLHPAFDKDQQFEVLF